MEPISTNFFLGNHELKIRIKQLDHESMSLIIDVPDDYNSPFTEFLDEMDDYWIGKLVMSWNAENIPNGYTGAFLYSFYINSNNKSNADKFISPNEIKSLRGLGKFMLCTAVSIGLNMGYLKHDTDIYLEADGGNCKNISKYSDYDINKYFERYPKEIEDIMNEFSVDSLDKIDREELIHYICNIEDNKLLINYYTKIYGFKDISGGKGTGVLMKSNINSIYSACIDLIKLNRFK